ncbi:MAG: SDR family NAD(P)-dependent oxidoreductase [Rhodospirillales bacterium]|nr:SDR family NAD(P)-dependent oxidoreductase [Rhodospirillales bacterium]
MAAPAFRSALIVGAGPGFSASLARRCAAAGVKVALASRRPEKLGALAEQTGGVAHACDVADADAVARLFAAVDATQPPLDLVVFNPSARVRGPIAELDASAVAHTLMVSAMGGFHVGQQAARRMLATGGGAILFTGASASVKGFAQSAPFAMGKFALRGLAQSMARELGPKGIHVLHLVIDGGIRSDARPVPAEAPDSLLDPEAVAETAWHALNQHRSAWSHEVEVRPWVERF